MELKKELIRQCNIIVNTRLQTVTKTISSHQKALQSETKSSAGDKHETGRAMLQLEMEKASQQLGVNQEMLTTLSKIDTSKTGKNAHLGSVIYTTQNNYFLTVSIGKLRVLKEDFFVVSLYSPIGRLLLGKKEKETIFFNGKTIGIKNIL